MSVWDDLIGQERLVEQLRAAAASARTVVAGGAHPAAPVAGAAQAEEAGRSAEAAGAVPGGGGAPDAEAGRGSMTHAWLFTGPPGSGRATAARAFAAALQCTSTAPESDVHPGCGHCDGCTTTLVGTHADVEELRTQVLSIGVDEIRALVRRASMSPAGGRWQVVLVEDADRLTEGAANALLKAVEEPAPRTVWLLCAPSLQDVLPTIRSRCRHVVLRTPSVEAVADVLVRRDGVDPAMAAFAARAAQGHIGRARRLATDEGARIRRADTLRLPSQLEDVGLALAAAQRLVDAAAADAKETVEELDARETEELRAALGAASGAGGRLPPGTAGVMKELEAKQKKRATRTQRDTLDRALVDLAGFYRDVLATQLGASVERVNAELAADIERIARTSTPEATLRRIDAVLACRQAIDRNAAPLLAVEAMAMALRTG
ncbi:DNA polymerase III subunit delta' [Allostreptomyces psammosilenae]|uniref:DNA polymerase-3 subunit delta n=1 Tax=Allostreptomyces psammosilenae TaxID=1892865 RepID=A0A852ZT97_9ACTN|nr:DNA polymerase III subunit delta' [Allostreptomyces psammosilenae]NYI05633.1 DNA polymerase-3 subunit delta' [Allostreptomyces psammosilenae]